MQNAKHHSLSARLLAKHEAMQAELRNDALGALKMLLRFGGGRIRVAEDSFLGYPSVYAADSRASILELRGMKADQNGDPVLVTGQGTLKAAWETLPFEELLQVIDILTKGATTYGAGEDDMDSGTEKQEPALDGPVYLPGQGVYIPSIAKVLAMRDEDGLYDFYEAKRLGAPTADEWVEIYRQRKKINKVLAAHGGQLLPEMMGKRTVYWTSSPTRGKKVYCFWFNPGYKQGGIETTKHLVRKLSNP